MPGSQRQHCQLYSMCCTVHSVRARSPVYSTSACALAVHNTCAWFCHSLPAGAQADGASAAGLVTFFNGTAWAAVRSASRAPVRHLKGVAGQAFAAVQEGTASIHYRTGGQWVRKVRLGWAASGAAECVCGQQAPRALASASRSCRALSWGT